MNINEIVMRKILIVDGASQALIAKLITLSIADYEIKLKDGKSIDDNYSHLTAQDNPSDYEDHRLYYQKFTKPYGKKY